MKKIRIGSVCLFLFAVSAWSAPADFKIEWIGACDAAGVDNAIRDSLLDRGVRVSNADGSLCSIWLRKAVPVTVSGGAVSYRDMQPGTFAGVIAYSGKAGDYRGQVIKPGVYTLRYAILPADGNHMGVSPTTDYFMLSPVEMDKNPNAVVDYEPLTNRGRKAAGTNHPAIIYLVEPAQGSETSIRDLGDNHYALEIQTKAVKPDGGGEMHFPMAIVLVGTGGG